jgi:tetratricopeptide (TPR) repeat protein
MSQKKLRPRPFSPFQPVADKASENRLNIIVIIALSISLTFSLLVVFGWLPNRVAAPAPMLDAIPAPTSTLRPNPSAERVTLGEPAAPGSPYQQAQQAKARQQAQSVLESILLEQELLQEAQVMRWAEAGYIEADLNAQAGDEAYRNSEFERAIELYQQSLTQLQQLRESIPERAETAALETQKAIEALDQIAAQGALERLLWLAPMDPRIDSLGKSVAQLPSIIDYLAQAETAVASNDWEQAKLAIDQAHALNSAHPLIAAQRATIFASWHTFRFDNAMSAFYTALDQVRYDAAEEALAEARVHRPNDPAIGQAAEQLETAMTQETLRRLRDRGQLLIDQEQWGDAITHYQEALALDSTVQYALSGLAFARQRHELEQTLNNFIQEPARLSDIAIADDASEALRRAQATDPIGPKLAQQLTTLSELLRQANHSIPVIVRSDGATEVVLVRHSKLGQLVSTELSLRPGQYTLRGSRLGYRDVIVTFTVEPDSEAVEHFIACEEKL